MTKDTIFRDYSMTKPVTGVAMMILYEEGKWLPSDPIAKHIPEFAGLKVFKGVDAEGKPILADPEHAPTMMELMSHSAGFTYGGGHTLADAMFREKKPMQSANLQEMINKVATLPLFYEPGKSWTYSMSMEIEGYIVEKLSGQTLPDFMRDHIFEPLEMKDAGFFVPQEKRSRFATNYGVDAQDHLVPILTKDSSPRLRGPTCRSLGRRRNGFHRRRFLPLRADAGQRRRTRRQTDPGSRDRQAHVDHCRQPPRRKWGIGQHVMRPGFGYGFNCAVVFDPPEAGLPDGKGTFFWDGAAGTWFWVDPTDDIVFVGMVQRMIGPDNHSLLYRSHSTVYQALVDSSK